MTPDQLDAEALRAQLAIRRSRLWKRIEEELGQARDALILSLGTTGLSNADRAMLQGKLAQTLDLLLSLPARLAEREIADRSPSPASDVPLEALHDRVMTPELM